MKSKKKKEFQNRLLYISVIVTALVLVVAIMYIKYVNVVNICTSIISANR